MWWEIFWWMCFGTAILSVLLALGLCKVSAQADREATKHYQQLVERDLQSKESRQRIEPPL